MTLNKEVFVNNLEKIMELRGITKDDLAPQFMTEEQKKYSDYNSLCRIEKDNYKKKINQKCSYFLGSIDAPKELRHRRYKDDCKSAY